MQKYVYDFTKFLTRDELINELKNINFVSPKKEEILETYNINIDGINISDIETTIRVNNFSKDIKMLFNCFDFSILESSNVGDEIERKKLMLLNSLKFNGIDLEICNIYELGRVINLIKNSNEIIEKLNKKYIDFNLIQEILSELNIDTTKSVINDILILINNMTYQQAVYLPVVRSKYYDENNNVFYKMKVDIPTDNHTNLVRFQGEIYESLEFENDDEAKKYALEHEIKEDLDSEIKTYIHFKGEEENDTWHKEMHIIKQRNSIVVKYGDHFIFMNENNRSITSKEIENIIEFLKEKTPNNEFLKYVIKELKSLRKNLGQKQYIRKNENIDSVSLKKIASIISDENYGEDRNIYLKSKIVSSVPLNFIKKEIKTLKK